MFRQKKKKTSIGDNIYKDYEPDGRELIELENSAKEFLENNPDYDPEDHWAAIETDKLLGK